MTRYLENKTLVVSSALVALLIIGLVAFYRGDQYALGKLSFVSVTPKQLANAMQQDEFYADYRNNIVIFSAQVSKVSIKGSKILVSFKTDAPYSLTCQFNNSTSLSPGKTTYKLEAVAYTAVREPSGVLLRNCLQL